MLSSTIRHRRIGIHFLIPAILALMLVSAGGLNAALTQDEQALLSEISIDRMMSTIEDLCTDEFRGRKTGTPGQYAAAEYLVSRFQEDDLITLDGLECFKQPLTTRYALIRSRDEIKATLSYQSTGTARTNPRSRTFDYRRYNGRGGLDIETEVVFVGHGVHDPRSGYSDYDGLDVEGKIVMWLSGQPSVEGLVAVTASHKMAAAYQHGAVGCLVYRPSYVQDEWGTNVGLSGHIADFPYIAVDESVIADLLSPAAPGNRRLSSSDLARLPAGTAGAKVRLQVTPVYDPERRTDNVIGMIPGWDSEVSDEVVLIGAHCDHLGDTPDGQIFHGADDNASGVSVLLEIARIIRDTGLSPRRTMVFAAWTGEEIGLVGSGYFANNPLLPLENIVSSINMDMVGVGNPGEFMTTGASAFPEHYRHLESSGQDLGYRLKADIIAGISDHLAFSRRGVPTSLVHSAGEHPHYHTVRDTPDTIDRRVLESSARLVALATWRAANDD